MSGFSSGSAFGAEVDVSEMGSLADGSIIIGDGVGAPTTLAAFTSSTGVLKVANGGTNAAVASITAFNNITGYTAAGATGTTSTNIVFSTSPTLVTPVLGAATCTTLNAMTITSSTGTFTLTAAKTLAVTNTLTLSGTDGTTMTFPTTSATIARTDAANTFTGVQVMTSPTISTAITAGDATFALLNTIATTVNAFGAATALNIGAAATCILNFGGSTVASEFRFLEPSASGVNYSAFKAVAQAANITYSLPPTVGAAGTYLRDVAGDGVLTWAAAGGASFVSGVSTDFQAAARYGVTSAGSATADFTTTTGVDLRTIASAGHYALRWLNVASVTPFGIANVFSTNLANTALGTTTYQSWSWCGVATIATNTLSLTTNHFGFRTDKTAGTSTGGATNANGTTETFTEFQATLSLAAFYNVLVAYQNVTTNIKYYGTTSLLATHTTNLPTGVTNSWMTCGITNQNTADDGDVQVPFMSLAVIV